MKYYKKIQGERVYLSPLNMDDIDVFVDWFNEAHVMNNMDGWRYTNNSVTVKEWFQNRLKSEVEYDFAIVCKDTEKAIGWFCIIDIVHIHKIAEVGIFIGDDTKRGAGLGTEAMNLGLKYGFDALNFNNIHLRVFDFNERAKKSYEKAGFKEYGRRRQAYYLNGEYHDVIYMDILRQEYYGSDE